MIARTIQGPRPGHRPSRRRHSRVPSGIVLVVAAFALTLSAPSLDAQTPPPAPAASAEQAYKLGMFRDAGRIFVGVVVADDVVLDLSRAGVGAPATLKELIGLWDARWAERIADLAAAALSDPPAYVFPLGRLKVLPPLDDPDAFLMAARNYVEHAEEMAAVGRTSGTTSVIDDSVTVGLPGIWDREANDRRPNPYLFPMLKSAITATGEPIVLPPGRPQVDFECELVAVIGRTARRVAVADALDHVFGYMAVVDVSDRQDRADGRYGSDWFMGKSHDTFAPTGPFVVPAAFVGDPQELSVRYWLNGELMQDASTSLMVHTVRDLVSFASHIATLAPGDLVGTGTPGGVGEGRTPPVYLRPGDDSVCAIERVGTIRNPVVAAPGSG